MLAFSQPTYPSRSRLRAKAREKLGALPVYVPWLLLMTTGYLTIELPFSSHLVPLLGGFPSVEDIESIERFGRMLSGIAVAIFALGLYLPKAHRDRAPVGPTLTKSALIALVSGAITYGLLDRIGWATGEFSSGATRKAAYEAVVLRDAMALTKSVPDSGWQAFVAMSPTLGADALQNVVGNSGDAAVHEAKRMLGSPENFRSGPFVDAMKKLDDGYQSYVKGSREFAENYRKLPAGGQEAWKQYNRYILDAFWDALYHEKNDGAYLRRQAKKFGADVPGNWYPWDGQGFKKAFIATQKRELFSRFNSGVQSALNIDDIDIQPGLSPDAFLASPAVQASLRRGFHIAESNGIITPRMSPTAFKVAVYQPAVLGAARDALKTLSAPPEAFANGGRYEEIGRNAAKSAFLPTMAILLSLAGAALHVFKSSYYLAIAFGYLYGSVGFAKGRLRHAVGACALVLFFGWFATGGSLTASSEVYRTVTVSKLNLAMAFVISLQNRFQPFGRELGEVGGWRLLEAYVPEALLRETGNAEVQLADSGEPTATVTNTEFPDAVPLPIPNPLRSKL